ncbi:hypothetical protein [Noviherbaspirillum sp.]|uniref:hypothetical protein n=1 Tax=Noviherbaspirillum sp. TaxID=1926288 RepID=UPI002FE02452
MKTIFRVAGIFMFEPVCAISCRFPHAITENRPVPVVAISNKPEASFLEATKYHLTSYHSMIYRIISRNMMAQIETDLGIVRLSVRVGPGVAIWVSSKCRATLLSCVVG